MDRDELEERVRRRPGETGFRRGQPIDDSPADAGYVPYQPEPEDALAKRPEPGDQGVYTGPNAYPSEETDEFERPRDAAAPPPTPEPAYRAPLREDPAYAQPAREDSAYEEPPASEEPVDAYDERPYGEPEDAYAYPYAAADERGGGGGGGGALPIIGFVVLCVLALAVGAVLAGLFGGEDQVGQATPTASASAAPATTEPTPEPTAAPSETAAPATPEPTDGPITFPDGAVYEIQPCGTYEFKADLTGCQVDGSTRDNGNVWILVVFDNASGDDDITVQLRSQGETLDSQDVRLGSIVNCGNSCRGLIWGAVYRDLNPGNYELVLRRNGSFADSAPFSVNG